MERYGPTVVISFSTIIFIFALVAAFWGRPVSERGIYISEELLLHPTVDSSAKLKAAAKMFQNKVFDNEQAMITEFKKIVGEEFASHMEELLLQSSEWTITEWKFVQIDMLTFASLTFGSLLFIIAGAYLPQLTSLKLAGMQLEKSSSERRDVSSSIGVSR